VVSVTNEGCWRAHRDEEQVSLVRVCRARPAAEEPLPEVEEGGAVNLVVPHTARSRAHTVQFIWSRRPLLLHNCRLCDGGAGKLGRGA